MPGQDLSRPLVGAGASASNDFANAEANAGIDFIGSAELKRGFKTDIGITAFTNASAGISKFISASIEGTAFASARAGIQGQLALNLFKEFGFVVKAEAAAEAAAGVKAALGINIGDFINLALQDKNNHGLPVELLIMLLEEVEIGGSIYIDVSISAKAHFTMSLSGTLLPKPGEKAGFNYTTKAGAGLAKGVGMSFKAGIGFKDFGRFYGRAVDRTVDEVILQINAHLPKQAKGMAPYISAFAPISKMALRMSYGIGETIIKNNIGRSKADAQTLCNECVKIILEEVQRFSLEKIAEYTLNEIKKRIIELLNEISDNVWEQASKERNELADLLLIFPKEPFQPTVENVNYWKVIILKTITLLEKLFPTATLDEKIAEQITILYCTTELSIESIRAKVNVARAYVLVPGEGRATANSEPFTGPLTTQPPQFIKNEINTKFGRAANTDILYVDLLEYLVDDLILDEVLGEIPELKVFINIFKEEFNDAEREILKLLLSSADAFISDRNGIVVPKDTLRILVKSIDSYITKRFKTEVLFEINKHITDPTLKTYLDEVFLICVIYTKDVTLNAALDWENAPYTNDDFTEALAGLMMMFLGRTVVLMSDTLLTATQNEVKTICDDIATKIERNPNHEDLVLVKPLLKDDNVKQLIVESLRVGGEVLGPLPEETRKRVRMLLYQIFEIIQPGKEKDFLEELGNQLFIPNVKDIEALTMELVEIAKYRFGLFAERILLSIGKFIMEGLEDLFNYLADLIISWEKDLADSLLIMAAELKSINLKLIALNKLITSQYKLVETAYNNFTSKLNSTQIKNIVKQEMVKTFFSTAEVVLKDHEAYKSLHRDAKAIAETSLRAAVELVLDSPVMTPIFNSISKVGRELEGLLPDAKRLDLNDNLSEQFLHLLLDKIEEKIRRHFGSTKPSIIIAVRFSYTIPELIITPALHTPEVIVTPAIHVPATPITPAYTIPAVVIPAVNIPAVTTPAQTINVNIPLDKIEINLNLFINTMRNAISTSDFYHDALHNFATNLEPI